MPFTQTRRSLIVSGGCGLLSAAAPSLLTTNPALANPPRADNGRFCVNCMGLFHAGYNRPPNPNLGVCEGNSKGPHVVYEHAPGHNFLLDNTGSERCDADTETHQGGWRFCGQCF